MDKLEILIAELRRFIEQRVPCEMDSLRTDATLVAARLERAQSETSEKVAKDAVLEFRREVAAREQQLRLELAEGDTKVRAQDAKIQALATRLDELEVARRGRVYENRQALSEVTGQLCDIHASLDCHSGRVQAELHVQTARTGTKHDDVYVRLSVLEEKRAELRERAASKVQSCSHPMRLPPSRPLPRFATPLCSPASSSSSSSSSQGRHRRPASRHRAASRAASRRCRSHRRLAPASARHYRRHASGQALAG